MECSICLDDIHIRESLRCGHSFCRSCIVKYEKKGGTNCPNCRNPFTITNYISKQDQMILLKLKLKNHNDCEFETSYRFKNGVKYRTMKIISHDGTSMEHTVIT